LSDINPQDFENLTYDILQTIGLKNLTWRTPGSDAGRDIEGEYYQPDISGSFIRQKWFIECKHYSSSIDWATVWKKIAHADSKNADFLLVATNSNPSPQCESEISNWNNQSHRVKIRFWRGYDFDRLLLTYPNVAQKFGVGNFKVEKISGISALAIENSKITSAAYLTHSFDQNPRLALIAASSISELIQVRIADLEQFGRYKSIPNLISASSVDGVIIYDSEDYCLSELTIRVINSVLSYLFKEPPKSKLNGNIWLFKFESTIKNNASLNSLIMKISLELNLEFLGILEEEKSIRFRIRQ